VPTMDMQAIAQIPNDTPGTFIYNALGWQHFEKNRQSSIADKVKAVAMTIFSILTLGAPVWFLKLAQISYLEEEAQGKKWIQKISEKTDNDAKIDESVLNIERFLEYQHVGLAIQTFELVSSALKDCPDKKEATLFKCAVLFLKYKQTELYKKTESMSDFALFGAFAELQDPNRRNQAKICEIY